MQTDGKGENSIEKQTRLLWKQATTPCF